MRTKKVAEILGVVIILGIIGLAIFNLIHQDNLKKYSKTELLMDTVFEIAVYTEDSAEGNRLLRDAFNKVRDLERLLSRYVKNSDVDRINQKAGSEEVQVSFKTLHLIERSLYFSEISEGHFDITIAPLLSLWGFGTGEERVPSEEEINEVLPQVNYQKIVLDDEENTVFLPEENMAVDLGGMAKGFIVDQIVEYLLEQGVEKAFVNAGGDIRVIGDRPDENPWRIAIRHPRQRDQHTAVLPVSNQAIVTSGDYERFITVDGERYHHILNPYTGMPADQAISVTIIAPDCMTADALSTAVFILGPKKGMVLLESLPDIEGVIIDTAEKLHVTSGIKDQIEILK